MVHGSALVFWCRTGILLIVIIIVVIVFLLALEHCALPFHLPCLGKVLCKLLLLSLSGRVTKALVDMQALEHADENLLEL